MYDQDRTNTKNCKKYVNLLQNKSSDFRKLLSFFNIKRAAARTLKDFWNDILKIFFLLFLSCFSFSLADAKISFHIRQLYQIEFMRFCVIFEIYGNFSMETFRVRTNFLITATLWKRSSFIWKLSKSGILKLPSIGLSVNVSLICIALLK